MRSKLPSYVQENAGEWAVVRENNRSARFRNPANGRIKVRIVTVDGGMITSGARADYVVAHPEVADVIVELKGSDVAKAIEQISATVPKWRQHALAGANHAALIVRGQGVHPNTSLQTQRLAKRFRTSFQMKLLIETRNRDYEFTEFLPQKS